MVRLGADGPLDVAAAMYVVLPDPTLRMMLPRLLPVMTIAAMGGALFGYDLGVTGGVSGMPPFLQLFYPQVLAAKSAAAAGTASAYCSYSDAHLQLWTSSMFLGGAAAALLVNFLTNRYGPFKGLGRRGVMVCGGFCFMIGAALQAGARDIPMLFIGRVILGGGIGFANQAVPLYISEMAPPKYRGGFNILFQLCCTVGIFVASLINWGIQDRDDGWRISLGIALVPAVIFALGSAILYDTPASILHLDPNAEAKARMVLVHMRGKYDRTVEEELRQIKENVGHLRGSSLKTSVMTLFSHKHALQCAAAFLIPFFQQFTGMNAIMFYAPQLFQDIGMGVRASLLSGCITNSVNLGATFVAIFTVDKFGRKKLFYIAGTVMLIAQIATATVFKTHFDNGHMSTASGDGLLFLFCVFVCCFAFSWGPLGWLVPSEIHTFETRQAGMAITVFVNFMASFIIGQFFNSMLCGMEWGVFLFFAAFMAIMTVYIAMCLPETKGVMVENIMAAWSTVPALPWNQEVVGDRPTDYVPPEPKDGVQVA